MSLAMQDESDPGQGIEYEWMDRVNYTLGEMHTLRFLELRKWIMTDYPNLGTSFDEPGNWSVTHLNLSECGPLTHYMTYVLQAPRDLQSLTMTSWLTPGSKMYGGEDPISIKEAVETLESIKDNLLELELDPGPSEHWVHPGIGNRYFPKPMEPYQSHAFNTFSRLERLTAPLEMFSQSTGKMSRREDHTFTPIFHRRYRSSHWSLHRENRLTKY
ncbi:unnamed protein product [Aureobasidium mustum]|uniref:Uncharacterized protein n=1 Tax=Aureobasidium mustum TaxID=2773714 RepID=A0A9N8K6I6_9PEZI|nr:unnamed protein product [Aureobasidium mustum]